MTKEQAGLEHCAQFGLCCVTGQQISTGGPLSHLTFTSDLVARIRYPDPRTYMVSLEI